MASKLEQYRTFYREFRENFYSTGSIIPSGRSLCRALATEVPNRGQPQRILEVGPGVGVVTVEIIRNMGPDDRLDLVEINAKFADILRQRIQNEWQDVAPRLRLFEMPIEDLVPGEDHCYECIVSGLPLSNFPGELVTQILQHIQQLSAHGATFSFFEYVALRKLKSLVVNSEERQRLADVTRIFTQFFHDWEFRRDCVLANFPPAWVHHLRFAAPLPAEPKLAAMQPSPC